MRIPPTDAETRVFLALGLAIWLPACAGLRDPAQEEEKETQRVDMSEERVFVGNVTLVNDRSRFVLIKTPVNQRLKAGMPMQSFRDGELSAELLFSPEQSFGFMTADISHGTPAVDDEVYLRYTGDFDTQSSPRMQAAQEKYEREQNMGFFEKRRYEREMRRSARKKKRSGE